MTSTREKSRVLFEERVPLVGRVSRKILDRDPTNLVVPEENRKRRDHPAQNPAPASGAAPPG
jgi:hypothetical protein